MNTLSKSSSLLLIIAGIFIALSIYFPIWRIELDAPQYPEGLALQIFANKIAGDVEVINGLNHYIGMKTIHTDDFWEFTFLPYILGFFAVCSLLVAFLKNRKAVLALLIGFLLFGVFAMYDFWKWEYDYGHDLDPTAAIQVPGMAYQPPLIGFKQLLNFGAYSIPDIGGWLMLAGGLLIAFVWLFESGMLPFLKQTPKAGMAAFLVIAIYGCSPAGPEPIVLHKDMCAFCKMKISEGHFAAEAITKKGRILKFDDVYCLKEYKHENAATEIARHYVHYHPGNNELIPAEPAFFVKSNQLKSPMAGNIAAFKTEAEAKEQAEKLGGELMNWNDMLTK